MLAATKVLGGRVRGVILARGTAVRWLSCDHGADAKYENLVTEKHDRAGLIRLNRPKALNALSNVLIKEICHAAEHFDADKGISAIVITGSEKAFAAGADIKEMQTFSFADAFGDDKFSEWNRLVKIRKPMIAAVNGYALGGGCELAMMCDVILAGDKAKFGQPEINLGVIPGWGGTQRLIRAIGKSKAMEMILTGNLITAEEAEKAGLVSRVIPAAELVEKALAMANLIGTKSLLSVMMVKEAVNAAEELGLRDGLLLEKRLFHSLFATADQKEGMTAFMEKRTPNFTHK